MRFLSLCALIVLPLLASCVTKQTRALHVIDSWYRDGHISEAEYKRQHTLITRHGADVDGAMMPEKTADGRPFHEAIASDTRYTGNQSEESGYQLAPLYPGPAYSSNFSDSSSSYGGSIGDPAPRRKSQSFYTSPSSGSRYTETDTSPSYNPWKPKTSSKSNSSDYFTSTRPSSSSYRSTGNSYMGSYNDDSRTSSSNSRSKSRSSTYQPYTPLATDTYTLRKDNTYGGYRVNDTRGNSGTVNSDGFGGYKFNSSNGRSGTTTSDGFGGYKTRYNDGTTSTTGRDGFGGWTTRYSNGTTSNSSGSTFRTGSGRGSLY